MTKTARSDVNTKTMKVLSHFQRKDIPNKMGEITSEYPTMAVHTRACYLSIYCQVFGYSDYTHQAYYIADENKAASMDLFNVPHSSLRQTRGSPKRIPLSPSPKNNFQHPMDDPLILNETNMINSKNDNTKRYL